MADEEDEVTRARRQAQQEHEAEQKQAETKHESETSSRSRTKTPTRTRSRDDRDRDGRDDDDLFSNMDREALRVRDEADTRSLDDRKIEEYHRLNPTGIPPGLPGGPGQPEFVPMGVWDPETGGTVDPPEIEAPEGLTATASEEEMIEAREAVNDQQAATTEAIRQNEADLGAAHYDSLAPLERERRERKGMANLVGPHGEVIEPKEVVAARERTEREEQERLVDKPAREQAEKERAAEKVARETDKTRR